MANRHYDNYIHDKLLSSSITVRLTYMRETTNRRIVLKFARLRNGIHQIVFRRGARNDESYERYSCAQRFFEKHLAAVIFALHGSLTVGFVVERLLDALVLNGESDTSTKAFCRYNETLGHVILWNTTDV